MWLVLFGLVIVAVNAVWPEPLQINTGSSTVWISRQVKLSIIRDGNQSIGGDRLWPWMQIVLGSARNSDDTLYPSDEVIIQAAFARFKTSIFEQNFVPYKFHPRNSKFEPEIHAKRQWCSSVIVDIHDYRPSDELEDDMTLVDEQYVLTVGEAGQILIEAHTSIGILHGFETLTQFFYFHSDPNAGGVYTPYAPIQITDKPRFTHRGLNIDVARNIIGPEHVKRTISGMAACKMNLLHIHATDAQSWPLEVPALPDLAVKGAYSPSQIWTTEKLRELQHFGALHGIEVYIEIDMPGHTSSIAHAYPELITAYMQPDWQKYSLEPPSGQLKLNSSAVTSFINTLLSDLLPRTTPYSKYFHLGGDEINTAAYSLDPTVNSSDPAILQPLIQSFTDRALTLLKHHNTTPIIWEEMLLDWNLTLPSTTIIQTWRSPSALSRVLQKGHRALFGASTHWYLDCGFGHWADPNPDDPHTIQDPFEDSCAPYSNWRHVYSYDPLEGVAEDLHGLVLGGEAHMWNELTDGVTLDGKVWPRLAAAAEVLWSGPVGGGRRLDESTTRRLAEFRERLMGMGIASGVVQMEHCLRYPGSCVW